MVGRPCQIKLSFDTDQPVDHVEVSLVGPGFLPTVFTESDSDVLQGQDLTWTVNFVPKNPGRWWAVGDAFLRGRPVTNDSAFIDV